MTKPTKAQPHQCHTNAEGRRIGLIFELSGLLYQRLQLSPDGPIKQLHLVHRGGNGILNF